MDIGTAIGDWSRLSRWERSEVGQALRRSGLSYGEIMERIPVPKGTLAGWCKSIVLTPEQREAIRRRTGSWKGVPRDTQRKRRAEIERIRAEAGRQVASLICEPAWVGGTALYWGEGAKAKASLSLTNTDERILRVFIDWVRSYHDPDARFVLSLHLHAGNSEKEAKSTWATQLGFPDSAFTKTHVKESGTGHRTNRHEHGVCRVTVRRSTDAWHRTMAWIDGLARLLRADEQRVF